MWHAIVYGIGLLKFDLTGIFSLSLCMILYAELRAYSFSYVYMIIIYISAKLHTYCICLLDFISYIYVAQYLS